VSTTPREDNDHANARVGTTVDRKWRLDALVAISSVAATYKATHRNGVETALKILHRSQSTYAPVVERFLQEAHLANRIDHPGVERVLDDGKTEDGSVFLVMELLAGDTLEDRRSAAGGKLALDDALPAFDGFLDALIAIHTAGVFHRNLKPANVFLATDGRVVLTDFGRARLAERDAKAALSVEGLVLGTPAYMSPEQAQGKRSQIDASSDIWSAGAILFTALTGRRVHEGNSNHERLLHAQTKPAPKIASLLPELAPAVADVIDRALAFEKKDRAVRSGSRPAVTSRRSRRRRSRPPQSPTRAHRRRRPVARPRSGWRAPPRSRTMRTSCPRRSPRS